MTQTSTTAAKTAAVTIEHLCSEVTHLELIAQAKTELEALEAGMVGLEGEDRARQNRAWDAQMEALTEIVKAALRAGVSPEDITAITYRESC